MPSRRRFLSTLPLIGTAAATSFAQAETRCEAPSQAAENSFDQTIEHGWQFCLDGDAVKSPAGLPGEGSSWQEICVPHTWQALGRSPDYAGVAWYRTEIHAPMDWQAKFVRTEFEAVFHTAHVFLNGEPIGEHIGKGYTAFTCDLTPALRFAESNELVVRVDNSFSDTMLPRAKSFDWANDGGITRPVHLLVTPRVFIERMEIDAEPDLEKRNASVAIRAVIRNTSSTEQPVQIAGFIAREGEGGKRTSIAESAVRVPPDAVRMVRLDAVILGSPALWHFDSPELYIAELTLAAVGNRHTIADTFGIRRFEVHDSGFYLNGERVFLMGVERMAGSHPQFGMAEPTIWIQANHRDMKELNCVFTRVHWPQDRRVLEFCDRNGILMQEEVPAWGSFTFAGTSDELQKQLERNGLEQLDEMISRDRNHPCIVSWGLCNEVDGKNPRTRAFANALAKEARSSDPGRLLTYASNSLQEHPEQDMAGEFDFISTNEYFGSWTPGGPADVREHLDRLRKAFPGKPIVVSEYGWCECQPSIPPGDSHRVEIVNQHTEVIREFPQVAGAIYFDYNDYRTIVGDKGIGALRQRVHGVVDLYANRKPSFEALRKQASPIEQTDLRSTEGGLELTIVTRKRLPAYTLRGYQARWLFYGYDDLPMEGQLDKIPVLSPGATATLSAKISTSPVTRCVVDILSPTGFSVATIHYAAGSRTNM